ncbi:hypothetical protein ACHAWU_004657 [Discostella pseudostelligera]|uniref:Uncharacterized protein n=1 Tax=Discostella pseudostelligera TaxID=259834 RepID=A0ABD3N5N8_9STRA
MAIDYSKWDRMDYDDDDDEDNDDDHGDIVPGTPQVTSLDRPGRVTIGPGGSSIEFLGEDDGDVVSSSSSSSSSKNDTIQSTSSRLKKPVVGIGSGIYDSMKSSGDSDVSDNQTQKTQHEADHHRKRTLLTRNGGMHHHTIVIPDHDHDDINTNSNNDVKNTRKGREINIPIYWSQDRYAVTVRIGINPTIFSPRNIRIQCKGALPYADRHSGVGSGSLGSGCDDGSHGSIEIVCIDDGRSGGGNGIGGPKGKANASSIVLLSEKLYHPIHLNEGEDELDFEIEDDNNFQFECDDYEHGDGDNQKPTSITKFVTVHLPKAVPMIGMTYWWDRLFVDYPTIDMDTIVRSDRKEKAGDNDDSNSKKGGDGTNRGEEFRKAWEGAHAAFRERMKTRERQSIDVDE